MRLLFLCHAHPELQAGGTEIFARDLFRALRCNAGITGAFVAGSSGGQRPGSPGTPFQAANAAADEVLLWTAGFDPFFQSQTDLHGVIPALAALLEEVRPDIVHIHHLMTLGLEIVGLIRRVVPRARIVMTLHDYYAVCANDGQMATTDGRLCRAATPDACRRCFPDRTLADFRLRELSVAQAFRQVDHFVSPSRFLRDRFVTGPFAEWGISPDAVSVIPNGLPRVVPVPHRASASGRRDRFGFFGHINRFKGATVALDASTRLTRVCVGHALSLHGGTAFQSESVVTAFRQALAAAPEARHVGPYAREDLPRLMGQVDWVVVPSVWWENAPLVILEAFQHRRPVISADVGGMAELVRDGVDGLYAAVADGGAFALAMRRGIEEAGLWQRLVDGIAAPPTIEDAAAAHLALYARLRTQRGERRAA